MSRVTSNILYNLCGEGAAMAASLISVSFVFRRLGPDSLGIIYFTLSVNGLLGAALESGLSNTVVREVAICRHDNPTYVHDLIRSAASFYWAAYVVLIVILWFAAPVLVKHWIHLQTLPPGQAVLTIRILGAGALLTTPRSLYTSLFRGLERMEFNNAIDVIAILVQQLGAVAIILAGGNLISVAAWLAATFAIWTIAYAGVAAWICDLSSVLPGFSIEVVRRNLWFASHMAGISVLSFIHSEIDKIVISKLLPLGPLGYYSALSRMVRRMGVLREAIARAAFPSFSVLIKQRHASALEQYWLLQDLVCFTAAPLFASVVFAVVPLFSVIFDRNVAASLLLPAAFLAQGHFMNCTLSMPYLFSLGAGRPDIGYRQNVVNLFVVIPLTIFLVWRYGLAGAGLSWIVFQLASYCYAVPRFCRECLRISEWQWYRHVGRIIVLELGSYCLAWTLMIREIDSSAERFFFAFTAGTIIYSIGAYVMAGDKLKNAVTARLLPLMGS